MNSSVSKIVTAVMFLLYFSSKASTYVVTQITDDVVRPTQEMLRGAIQLADADVEMDTIVFNANLSGSTILLKGGIFFNESLVIIGLGPDKLTIDGSGLYRVFDIEGDAKKYFEISGIRFENGVGTPGGEKSPNGGAIRIENQAKATIRNCVFYNNTAESGGAVYYDGLGVTIESCSFLSNTIDVFKGQAGGGLYVSTTNGRSYITNCHFDKNSAALSTGGGSGAAVYIYQNKLTTTIKDCSFINNEGAEYGGAIFFTNDSDDTLRVINSTFGGNRAEAFFVNGASGFNGFGGAIYSYGHLELYHNTFTDNYSTDKGAIFNSNYPAIIQNNVFYNNKTSSGQFRDFYSLTTIQSLGGNFVQDTTGWAGLYKGNFDLLAPTLNTQTGLLNPLKFSGKITYYYSPVMESIITDAAVTSVISIPLDQLGQRRSNPADIGAVEASDKPTVNSCLAPFLVTTTVDSDTLCGSLRYAIIKANEDSNPDVIRFSEKLIGDTIILDFYDEDRGDYDVVITEPLTIEGFGLNSIIISSIESSIFTIDNYDSSYHYTFNGLHLTGGYGQIGAALRQYEGHLHLKNCTFSDNQSGRGGAVYYNGAGLDIDSCVFTDNTASSYGQQSGGGGALYVESYYGNVSINHTRFDDNSSSYSGGNEGGAAIFNVYGGALLIQNSSFVGNKADYSGAAFYSYTVVDTATIINCTFSQNTTLNPQFSRGGAIYMENDVLNLIHNTFVGNGAEYGGAIALGNGEPQADLLLQNSVFFNNYGSVREDDISLYGNILYSKGGNFIQDTLDFGLNYKLLQGEDFFNQQVRSLFNPLTDEGSFTSYYMPLGGTVLIDNGTSLSFELEKDQYGNSRIQKTRADIGAIETPYAKPLGPIEPIYGVHAISDSNSVEVSWFKSADLTVDKYYVYLWNDFEELVLIDSTNSRLDTSVTISGFEIDELYNFTVTALRTATGEEGDEYSSTYDFEVPVNEAGLAVKTKSFLGEDTPFISLEYYNNDEERGSSPHHLQEFTFEAWINITGEPLSKLARIFSLDYSEGNGEPIRALCLTDDFHLYGYVDFQNGTITESLSKDSLLMNQWYHVAMTRDSLTGTIRLYINGKEVSYSTQVAKAASIPVNNGFQATIGGSFEYWSEYFKGEYDEPRIWDKALTSQEIIKGRDVRLKGNEKHLVGMWHFDEPGDNYYLYDATLNKIGAYKGSGVTTVPSKAMHPFKPENLTSSYDSINHTVRLVWNKNLALDIKETAIYRGYYSEFEPNVENLIAKVNYPLTSYTDDVYAVSGVIYYKVIAVDSAYQYGPASDAIMQEVYRDLVIDAGDDDTTYAPHYTLNAIDEPLANTYWSAADSSIRFSDYSAYNAKITNLKKDSIYELYWHVEVGDGEYLTDTVRITVLDIQPKIKVQTIQLKADTLIEVLDLTKVVVPYKAIDSIWVRGPFDILHQDDISIDVDIENFILRVEVLNNSLTEFQDSVLLGVCNGFGSCDSAYFSILRVGEFVPSVVGVSDVKVYNFLSPNGDGLNEFFDFEVKDQNGRSYSFLSPDEYDALFEMIENIELKVFNRWSDHVAEIDSYYNPINNVWAPKNLPNGTYFYKLVISVKNDTKQFKKTGFIEIR